MRIGHKTLKGRVEEAYQIYQCCNLCPHKCKIDRTAGELGVCGQSDKIKVSAMAVHRGEETVLDRGRGVGNIFLAGCSANCVYCQNYQASQLNMGFIKGTDDLAKQMIKFQKMGLNSVGWVTPAHFIPGLLKSAMIAHRQKFSLPIVYNTSSYERTSTIKLAEDVVDIYLADLRYSSDDIAKEYSQINNYTEISHRAIEEMYRQVGAFDETKQRGLIIRLLVLPNNQAGIWESLCFIALELSKNIPISIMSQYQPVNRVNLYPQLNRTITKKEYYEALRMARELGFSTIYAQRIDHRISYLPDFNNWKKPFGKWNECD